MKGYSAIFPVGVLLAGLAGCGSDGGYSAPAPYCAGGNNSYPCHQQAQQREAAKSSCLARGNRFRVYPGGTYTCSPMPRKVQSDG